jgi:hypothetical protein
VTAAPDSDTAFRDSDGGDIIALARQIGLKGVRGSNAPASGAADAVRSIGASRVRGDGYGGLDGFDLSSDDDGRASAFLARAIGISGTKPLSAEESQAFRSAAAGARAPRPPAPEIAAVCPGSAAPSGAPPRPTKHQILVVSAKGASATCALQAFEKDHASLRIAGSASGGRLSWRSYRVANAAAGGAMLAKLKEIHHGFGSVSGFGFSVTDVPA